MKKRIATICTIVMFMLMVTPLHAKEDGQTGLVFEGDSSEFIVTDAGNTTGAFEDIMPGEERVQKISLSNDSYENMKFYVRTQQSKSLGEGKVNGEIVYDVAFKSNDEAFYTGRVGGPNKKGIVDLDSNYLLKSLKKGESVDVLVSVKVDGTSMDNNYQGTQGDLGFVFSVEHDEPTTLTKVVNAVNKIPGINTGDKTAVGVLLAVVGLSAVVIVFIIIKKRREKGDRHE